MVTNYVRVGIGVGAPVFFFDGTRDAERQKAWDSAVEAQQALTLPAIGGVPPHVPAISIWRRVLAPGPWRSAQVIGYASQSVPLAEVA